MANPFAIGSIEQQPTEAVNPFSMGAIDEDRRTELRSSLMGAQQVNPEEAAKAAALARQTGAPYAAVQANLKQVEQSAQLDEYERMLKGAPAAAAFMRKPENAAVAHDDVANLTAIEEAFREAQRGGRAVRGKVGESFVRAGDERTSGGRVGEKFRRSGRMLGEERGFIGGITEPVQRGLAQGDRGLTLLLSELGILRSSPADLSFRMATQQRQVERFPVPGKIEQGMQAISGAETFGEAARAAASNPRAILEVTLQSLGASAPSVVGAVAGSTMGPAGTAAGAGLGSFAVEYASTLQDAMAEKGIDGKDPDAIRKALGDAEFMAAARTKAVKRGIAVGVFDALTAGLAGRMLAGAKPTVASVATRATGELALQAGGGATGEAVAQAATGEYKPGDILLEALAEMPSAVVEVPSNMRHAAQRAEEKALAMEKIGKLAEASKLNERDKPAFRQFLAEVAQSGEGPAEFFVDGEVLANTLNQSAITMQELEAIAPTVARQLREGVPGADVRVPTAELLSAPSEILTPLLDHIRESENAMSRAEAQEYLKTEGEKIKKTVDGVLADTAARDARKESFDTAHRYFEGELAAAGRYTPQVNKALAVVPAAFYATKAEAMGVTVEEFMDRYQLRVVGKESAAPLGKRQKLEQAPQQSRPDPVKQREMIELRKQESVLKSLITCLGGA